MRLQTKYSVYKDGKEWSRFETENEAITSAMLLTVKYHGPIFAVYEGDTKLHSFQNGEEL